MLALEDEARSLNESLKGAAGGAETKGCCEAAGDDVAKGKLGTR